VRFSSHKCRRSAAHLRSGTNDRRYLLPLDIFQDDPVGQSSTNALVLMYLLQPENDHYSCMLGPDGNPMSSQRFLEVLVAQTPQIRVLLDVGGARCDHNVH
jgi:hypothetical protein